MKPFFYDLTSEKIAEFLEREGEPKFRLKQIIEWQKSLTPPAEMTNLSKQLREKLAAEFDFKGPKLLEVLKSGEDQTRKYLFRLRDGQLLEAVLMSYKYGHTLCLSTQAGCRMGCDFCASAKVQFARNLSSGEMLVQMAAVAKESGQEIKRLVLMGIGEPMENLNEVLKFCNKIHSPELFNISYRRITISTCGLVPEIRKLADQNLPITLSISLHQPFQEEREKLMPIAKRYSLAELLSAADYYFAKTGRRVSYEYALFRDYNDSEREAEKLLELFKGRPVHINLIPANHFPGSTYYPPSRESVLNFKRILEQGNVKVTLRRSLGRDIEAACGQLRLKHLAPDAS